MSTNGYAREVFGGSGRALRVVASQAGRELCACEVGVDWSGAGSGPAGKQVSVRSCVSRGGA